MPYLNAYVEKQGGKIDEREHKFIGTNDKTNKQCRQIFFRIIGNGTAKNIEIWMRKNNVSNEELPVRNGFLLVNKQYVFDLYFDDIFEKVSFECRFTDLLDNQYYQKITVSYNS